MKLFSTSNLDIPIMLEKIIISVVPKIKIGNDNSISAGEVLFDNLQNRKFFQSGYIVDKP